MRSLGSDEGKLLAVMGEEVSKQVQTMDGLRNLRKFCALISTERESERDGLVLEVMFV